MSGLLGVTGPDGAGKTTVGDMLVSAGWHRVKFAGLLKDARRAIDPDLCVSSARREIIANLERGRNVVVDDVCFENEHQAILDLGGAVLRLEGRGGIGKHRRGQTLPAHIIFENTGTPDGLRKFIEFTFLQCD